MILNIDTATERASIALSNEAQVLELVMNEEQKDHAAWIHKAIQEVMSKTHQSLQQLNAVAVTAGPGSYTGLRVGMATAKGLCYALGIPMITENTLKVMARAALEDMPENKESLLCPMIDARRMEVFTGVYNAQLAEIMQPRPMVLNENSFADLLAQQPVTFFGSGSHKFREQVQNANAAFTDVRHHAGHLSYLAWEDFQLGRFTDPAYAEPVYLKEFYTHTKK